MRVYLKLSANTRLEFNFTEQFAKWMEWKLGNFLLYPSMELPFCLVTIKIVFTIIGLGPILNLFHTACFYGNFNYFTFINSFIFSILSIQKISPNFIYDKFISLIKCSLVIFQTLFSLCFF